MSARLRSLEPQRALIHAINGLPGAIMRLDSVSCFASSQPLMPADMSRTRAALPASVACKVQAVLGYEIASPGQPAWVLASRSPGR